MPELVVIVGALMGIYQISTTLSAIQTQLGTSAGEHPQALDDIPEELRDLTKAVEKLRHAIRSLRLTCPR
jgi:predicted  nucleic acid-binding Zn-ribbon protein